MVRVPEPSAWAAIAGMVLLAWTAALRRRSRFPAGAGRQVATG
ncbi:MAG: PEP-CTERM sorting domain-containing protein [Opitutaceae bacterium]|jgi:hypothetical protein|nr:PEP-CTERM sorting domain-containing protein [Opitutaceae bacterium]